MDRFAELGVRIAGCSVDDLDAQQSFAKKHSLRFPLISDADASIAKGFEVYREDWKVATRATAVIGEDQTVLKTYPDAPANGKGHAEAVYMDAKALLT